MEAIGVIHKKHSVARVRERNIPTERSPLVSEVGVILTPIMCIYIYIYIYINSVASVRKRTIPTERPSFVREVSANFFADRGCHVASVTNPYGRILGFLDQSRCYFF
jgi:hypothetical protein